MVICLNSTSLAFDFLEAPSTPTHPNCPATGQLSIYNNFKEGYKLVGRLKFSKKNNVFFYY